MEPGDKTILEDRPRRRGAGAMGARGSHLRALAPNPQSKSLEIRLEPRGFSISMAEFLPFKGRSPNSSSQGSSSCGFFLPKGAVASGSFMVGHQLTGLSLLT